MDLSKFLTTDPDRKPFYQFKELVEKQQHNLEKQYTEFVDAKLNQLEWIKILYLISRELQKYDNDEIY